MPGQSKVRGILIGALLPAVLLAVWSTATFTGWVPAYLMPTPWDVVVALYGFILGLPSKGAAFAGGFTRHATASIARVLAGFVCAATLGIPAGMLSGRSPKVRALIDPGINLLRSVPGIAWLPLAMIWFGIGNVTTLFLITLAAFFPVYISSYQGARTIPPRWIQTAAMLGATRRQILCRVVLPGALPSIEAGLRLALGISWAYVVLGELTGVNQGLGAMIMDARMLGDVLIVIVGIICIAVLGRISDLLLQLALRWVPGHAALSGRRGGFSS